MTVPRAEHVEVRRHAERGSYDREVIDAILNEAPFCHVGFVHDGRPVVIPTIHVRVDDSVILHGSPASRMLRTLAAGPEVSIAVTLLDGLVLARSVFNHSMNYRSVVMFGRAEVIEDEDLKLEAMRVFTEKILPGRWDDARRPSRNEFKGTLMLAVPIDAASAKVRTGPPIDGEHDHDLDVWAGVIPIEMVRRDPVPDPALRPGIDLPGYLGEDGQA